MDRRTFLVTAGAAMIAPAIPTVSQPVIGLDFAAGPDQTVYRLMSFQRGLIREVHRVTGIPRYQMGRDTWQDQVDAGLSEIVESEEQSDE